MKKNFDTDPDTGRQARFERDRDFVINGVELTHRPSVAPEDVQEWAAMVGGEFVERGPDGAILQDGDGNTISSLTESQAIKILDGTIRAFLEPGQEEKWAAARDPRAENPIGLSDLRALVAWLFEETSGRPTGPSSGSQASRSGIGSDGPATPSTGASPSPALAAV